MITSIPDGQICEAFDPMMFLPEKTLTMIGVGQNANPSCVAPAFVYIEGTHGKKFLCDYHYYYEMNMTKTRSNTHIGSPWESIQEFILDEREKIKDTFPKNVTTTLTLGHKCSIYSTHNRGLRCTGEAFVRVIPAKYPDEKVFYCNFHFRKNYYRWHSNGAIYQDAHQIVDERYRMTQTIADESSTLNCV